MIICQVKVIAIFICQGHLSRSLNIFNCFVHQLVKPSRVQDKTVDYKHNGKTYAKTKAVCSQSLVGQALCVALATHTDEEQMFLW